MNDDRRQEQSFKNLLLGCT